ncbi:ABC transporter permease [Mucilaginibacter sp. UR6-11]|uniref:ABC transporter permease n=1 Tax=Mucilaginibacter sp. UR6-11 TaxID=1435644 RepID=UPI001E31BBC1|nr:ABC transporter permease [Mucilaginibacter sp. UR6-11]MCC8424893.1 ABC transporter permease [Mucilaginibacter sp. UR6-11]
MIKNYLKTAWRNLISKKFYSAINIIGLTIGLAVGLLILIWVKDELSYDRFNTKIDQIYKVNASIGTGASRQVWGNVSAPVAFHALKDVPGVINAVRIIQNYNYSTFRYKDKILRENGNNLAFVDDSFFKMFDFKLLKGNINKPFINDQSVIITERTAKRYFGSVDPVGKTLMADSKDPYTVSGVIADFPGNSSITGNMLFSIDRKRKEYDGKDYWKAMDEDWGNYFAQTFLQIKANESTKAIGEKLTRIHFKYQKSKSSDGVFQLQPMADIHLYNPDGSAAGIQTVKVFSIVAILILIIACINYVNLSTARAMLRSKEVSIRKIIGADRKQLFIQFIIETALCFTIALLLAFILIYISMPLYNKIAGKQMHFDLFSANVWQVVALTVIATLVASSIYPALLLSSFKPISALKGKISGAGNASFRKALVVCQFAFSIGLIIGTIIINKQLNYIHTKQLGYDKEHVFALSMHNMRDHYTAIKAQLLTHPEVLSVTASDNSIINSSSNTGDTDWDGKDPNTTLLISPFEIDKDFLPMFKVQFIAGRNFTASKSDTANFILNETAVKITGIKNPLGKRFKLHSLDGTIIGVVKDFHFASLKETIKPLIFSYRPTGDQMFIKTSGKNATAAIKLADNFWKQYNSNFPYEYTFLDDTYNAMYKTDQQTGILFDIFAGIAIFISCLGLFGLATYTAQVKVKEIGIRKVLGASVANITAMLSKDFLVLVIIAFAIASPIAWYMMSKWLMGYAYRAQLHWWIIGVAGFAAILIAFLTISFQSIKAALANPVKSLRSE